MAQTHNFFREQQGYGLSSEIERLVSLVVKDRGPSLFTHGEQSVISYCQNISPVIQKGPMCGLVGLTMAAQLLLKGGAKPCHTADRIHPESILEYAVQNGLSRQGEMFSANSMEKIAADHLQLQPQVVTVESHEALLELVVQTISGDKAILVPYDADKDHTPCLARGQCAHWCVLVGLCLITRNCASLTPKLLECCQQTSSNSAHYVVRETGVKEFTTLLRKTFDHNMATLKESLDANSIYVFARHGKTSHLGLWSLKDLLHSNGNLVEVDPRRSDPLEHVIPRGGLEEGLRNKVVFITK